MQEILFKAKKIDNGEWVEGFYMNIGGKYHYILEGWLDITHGYPDLIKFAVDPKTVCQYTGLTDKNGNKIWENDIVRKTDANALGWTRIRNCKVHFNNFGYWAITTEYGDSYWIGEFDKEQLEVIGNIFDNSELMEVE